MAVMDRMESINTCPQRLNSGRGRRSMARPSSDGKASNFCATPELDTKSTSGLQNSAVPPQRQLKVVRFYAHGQALSSAKNSLSPQSEKFQYEKFLHEIGTLLVGYLLAETALASTIRACGDCRGKRVCLRVAEQLSDKYNAACREFRAFGLPHSAAEKLAKLLLELSVRNGEAAKAQPRIRLALTHDEMAQMIGTSRETVTGMFADLTKHQIVEKKGSTLRIRNKTALKALALTQ